MIGMSLSWTSKADTLFIALDSPSLSGAPGTAVTFTGTLQNSSGAEVFLNGAGGNMTYSEFTLDLTPFFTLAPLSIPDGESYSGPLFSVAISNVAVDGDYPGNSFFIEGGADAATFDTVGTAVFDLSVATPTSVPEPSSAQLLGFSVLVWLGVSWWRRTHANRHSQRVLIFGSLCESRTRLSQEGLWWRRIVRTLQIGARLQSPPAALVYRR